MAILDILCVIDAASLPSLSQTPENPAQSLNSLIYVIMKDARVIRGQAGSALITAKPGDVVRWRVTSVDCNFVRCVTLFNFKASQEGLLSPPVLLGGASEFGTPFTANGMMPVQGPMPWSTTNVAIPFDFFETSIQRPGALACEWWFQVHETTHQSLVGYGMWNLSIEISA